MIPFIRYFASTDDSATGKIALEYFKALTRIAPVRLLITSPALSRMWEPYARALATPITYPMVNVVCCQPSRWIWTQHVKPSRGVDITGRVELYTTGIRNVLIAAEQPTEMSQLASALKYETIIVPTLLLKETWQRSGRGVTLVAAPVTDQAGFRDAVLGE